jgi:hypothetical protein
VAVGGLLVVVWPARPQPTTVASCWLIYLNRMMMHGPENVKDNFFIIRNAQANKILCRISDTFSDFINETEENFQQ